MNLYPVFFMLLLLCLFCTIVATIDGTSHFTRGDISINCGSSGASAVRGSREWFGDVKKKASSIVEVTGSSTTSTVIDQNPILDPVPYKTARLSLYQFSYAVQVNPGPKILRLHFNSARYKGFKRYKDLFSVEAGPFTLLSNFSAFLAAHVLGVNSFVKEFCINIDENQLLSVVFSPASSPLRDMYAFVNGIEIVSIPATHSYFHVEEDGVQLVGKSSVYVDKSNALEIIRRVNMKRDYVSLSSSDYADDELGTWEAVPKENENKATSITWKVSVDVGFRYLIRLHFSRLGFKVADIGGFVFEVQINGKIADISLDRVKKGDEDSLHWYADYVVMMKGSKQEGVRDMLIDLHSNGEFVDGHGPVKGFEILKVSNHDNSLDSPNSLGFVNNPSHQTFQIIGRVLGHKNAIASAAVVLLVLLNLFVNTLWIIQEASQMNEETMTEEENMLSAKAEKCIRRFSLAEIRLATQNFSGTNLIGRGGFGKVYKGTIDNGEETVAVKRLKQNSSQGAHEFLTEIETLAELRHVNLVSLIGYCNECKEMVLVYKYMASGTLADHLFKHEWSDNNTSSLTWKQLLNICIGAGRGLDYLHTGHSIIHRDVKASNILLDDDFTAKVADFGLAKLLHPTNQQKSHVSTKVKGTFGYWDPEYLATGKLTMKSDAYSFGVVLLEVLSGRRASDPRVSIDEQNLIRWAKEIISKGKFDHLVALKLRGQVSDNGLKAFADIVGRCLHDEPKKRPTMAEVVLQLQHALDPPESSKHTASNEKSNLDDNHNVQFKNHSEEDRIVTPPVKEKSNSKFANFQPATGMKDLRKSRLPKPSPLWPWGAFQKKGEPSASNEIVMSAVTEDKHAINRTPVSTPSSPPGEFMNKLLMFFIPGRHKDKSLRIFSPMIKKPKDLAFLDNENGLAELEVIGRGGCDEVYKAVLPGPDGKEIAIKKIILPSSEEEDINEENSKLLTKKMQQIKSEIKTIGQIRHRNLLPLLAHLPRPNCHYLVYEYMKNGSLHDYLQEVTAGRRELDWLARYKIALGVAAGLEYLHINHTPMIIHRDLKPANILLDDEMEARIADFGLAKSMPESDTHVTTSKIAGTVGYIAPEYYKRFKFTDKFDIYSFGVVLGVLVMGKLPSDEFFQSMEEISLVKWMRNTMTSDDPKRALDPKLVGQGFDDQMLLVLKVACFCTVDEPMDRPNSKDARCMLAQLKND